MEIRNNFGKFLDYWFNICYIHRGNTDGNQPADSCRIMGSPANVGDGIYSGYNRYSAFYIRPLDLRQAH
jgi:hypothetical protein